MRKFLSIIALLMFVKISVSQVFLTENFDTGYWPPWGWSIENTSYWKKSATNYAGGSNPEARNTIILDNEGYKLISREIDLLGYTSVNLIFKHFVDYSSGSYTLQVSTQSGRGAWHEVWSYSVIEGSTSEEITINITNEDVGKHDFRFAFHVEDIPSGTVDYWFIDNIILENAPVLDCSLEEILTPSFISEPIPVSGRIKNNGSAKVTSVEIEWNLGSNDTKTTTFRNLNIRKDEEYTFNCDDTIDNALGKYNLTVTIKNVNGEPDEISENNTLSQDLYVVVRTNPRIPLFECFTSSTSPPCAQLNSQLNQWFEDNSDELVYIKYPVNWPSPGDPYFTHDYGVRVNYYDVTTLPGTIVNGDYAGQNMQEIEESFNEADDLSTVFDIASSFKVEGTKLLFDTKILPYANIDSLNVFIIAFEKTTEQNIGSNGETEFKHIILKMINGPDGSYHKFKDRTTSSFVGSTNLNDTYVEEYNDLGVAIFIQDYYTKEVLQCEYSVLNGSFNNDATLSDLRVDGYTIDGFDPGIFNYIYILPPNTYQLPEVTAVATDSNAITIITTEQVIFGKVNIQVWAEDLVTNNTYSVEFYTATDVNTTTSSSFTVFPNPSSGVFNVSNSDEIQRVVVYDQTGNIILNKSYPFNSFNLSNCSNGIYYACIFTNEKTIVKRIVLTD